MFSTAIRYIYFCSRENETRSDERKKIGEGERDLPQYAVIEVGLAQHSYIHWTKFSTLDEGLFT